MSNTNKVKDIINKLCTKYEKTSWGKLLPDVFQTEDFELALGQLISDVQAGQPFTPVIKDLFKSFDQCPLSDVKVVFVNAHPNPEQGIADGLAYSGYNNPFTNSLPAGNQLSHLPSRGVMLLNMALTCPVGKPKDHIPMWDPIATTIINQISYQTLKTVFVFIGSEVEHLANQLTKFHRKIFVPSFQNGDTAWDNIDMFKRINIMLEKADREPIVW